jgi:UDP-2,3-diacylglucosamine hydrolase
MELKEGAVLIGDVHYHADFRRDHFLEFLSKIEEILPPQLILFGDIFELLFGGVKYTEKKNVDVIKRLNRIGEKVQILYLEGNHDFNLKKLFPKLVVISIFQQPFLLKYNKKKIYISHGDSGVKGFFYFYRRVINSNFILKFISFADSVFGNPLLKILEFRQEKKRKCHKIKGFKDIIKKKLGKFGGGVWIDGHYHQGVGFNINDISYYNLFAFACNQSCFIVKSKQNTLFIKNISLKEL